MKIILSTLKKILFWSYERGSWQYDVMCVLILAFIFLAPNRAFHRPGSAAGIVVRADEIGQAGLDNPELAIRELLQRRRGYAVNISHIEKAEDSSGGASYVVYEK